MPDDVDLDNAIDDVAREITSGSVDANFARRVSVRINDVEAVRARRVWSRTWLLVPATAGVAVLAVFLIRDMQSPSSVRLKPDATTATTHGTADATVATAGAAAVATSAAAVTTAAGPTVDTPRASALSVAPRDPNFEPLTTAPIEMASLDVSPLLGVMPIEIAAIAIDRIEIPVMP